MAAEQRRSFLFHPVDPQKPYPSPVNTEIPLPRFVEAYALSLHWYKPYVWISKAYLPRPLWVRALLPRVIWTGVGPKLLKVMAPKSPGDSANGGERREEDERRGKDKKEGKKNERVKRVKLVGGQVGREIPMKNHQG